MVCTSIWKPSRDLFLPTSADPFSPTLHPLTVYGRRRTPHFKGEGSDPSGYLSASAVNSRYKRTLGSGGMLTANICLNRENDKADNEI